jgi:flavin reductase (DIM6/NTAB) family NADH-FMN oxidoreductase RutF
MEGIRSTPDGSGAPTLAGVAAVFECVPWARHDAGDHRLFIMEVKRFRSNNDRMPLVFCKGRYATLQPTEVPALLWPLDIHY